MKYELIEKLGVIQSFGNGTEMVLNFISWNGEEPVYDVRPWQEGRFFRGMRFTASEMETLVTAYEDKFASESMSCQRCADSSDPDDIGGGLVPVELYRKVAELSPERENGFSKWLTITSWNGESPKFDIRDWSRSFQRMRPGLKLEDEPMRLLAVMYRAKCPRQAAKGGVS